MIRIALVVGSTRPGRRGIAVARWVLDTAATHPAVADGRASIDILDVAGFDLPMLDEPVPTAFGTYAHSHTRRGPRRSRHRSLSNSLRQFRLRVGPGCSPGSCPWVVRLSRPCRAVRAGRAWCGTVRGWRCRRRPVPCSGG
ncbi:NADPH-dependent FMN reductase, partial [Actinomadura bangladeshensis]|uniref:NADPH-dependent FMN reductase n=1 Tax=Actinomadura bangladeshensis TaxID=453573 RepID=UPI003CD06E87